MSLASPSAAAGMARPLPLQRSLRLGIGAVYGAAAVPLFFIYNILPASLRQAGQPPEAANLVFLAYLPFALRVAWAPVVARLGREQAPVFRCMVLVCLALAVAITASLAAFEPHGGTSGIIAVATLAIMAIATAAVALDGYLLAGFPREARVRSAPLQGIGFALGGLVMGAGIMLCDGAGWSGIILLLVLITAGLALPALLLPGGGTATDQGGNGPDAASGLWRFLRSVPARRRLAFSLLGHGGLGLAGGMLPVLQVDAGLSLGQIGLVAAIGANGVGVIASWATGLVLRGSEVWRVALLVSLASAFCFAGFALSGVRAEPMVAIALSLAVMALGYAFFVVFRALVLPICAGDRGTTQAAALSSIDALVATVSAIASGFVLGRGGLPLLLGLAAGFCAAGALVAWRARRRGDDLHTSSPHGARPS
ncbi:hypothetical protein [Bosea minatitlanensis]|uniref:MFS transporter n=1 Tax=Bosea minatitlanensis TaxID=128782 RepID=A0ABW0FBG5_9HYPH|nr:hypothetical protein [Bosea minatitlanensis]MCT4494888.1 hypothetical protein [Bosea minatitlanensis]